ncbi:MFS transporter [Nocardia sp. NPDC059091]|uniref:MFS transporter n=1 Tax=unclassified Nocardia TaxID=2637762 RepID=UPI0036A6E6F9
MDESFTSGGSAVTGSAPGPGVGSGAGDVGQASGLPLAPRLRRLAITLPFASAAPQLGFAVSGYFLALQVQSIDESAKVGNLAIVHACGATAAMLAQPLIGVLSDHTRTRLGARPPWLLAGALLGAVGLLTAGLSHTVAMLVIASMAVQFGLNAVHGPLTAILPDRVPRQRLGRFSTLAGLGTIGAGVLGPVLASQFRTRIPLGYACCAGLVVLIVVAFVGLNPGADNRDRSRAGFSWKGFLRGFWVDPRRHPDFAWAFAGRFLILGGYYMVLGYHLYLAQNYIGLSQAHAARLVPLIAVVALPGFLVAIAVAGPISDRIGRRKPLALLGGLVIAAAPLLPLLWPTVAGMMISGAVVTVGFGIYLAVDQALVTEILPSAEDFAKDLGVLNIAATLPNVLAPLAAAAIVSLSGTYGAIYLAASIVATAGALAVLPIRGVR